MDRGRVARSTVDGRWRGPKAPERGGALTEAWPPATLKHGCSSAWASPGLGRRRGDRATVEERKLDNCRARVSEEGESEMGEVQ
jgi:hypothetical protein